MTKAHQETAGGPEGTGAHDHPDICSGARSLVPVSQDNKARVWLSFVIFKLSGNLLKPTSSRNTPPFLIPPSSYARTDELVVTYLPDDVCTAVSGLVTCKVRNACTRPVTDQIPHKKGVRISAMRCVKSDERQPSPSYIAKEGVSSRMKGRVIHLQSLLTVSMKRSGYECVRYTEP
ncbi:hypothetical protein NDU88_000703 [Pleurodeles waltl]|uniref:Uncharacterized protein n=1 Tax=Pleurodeles waltl TaxID=8319 RepID=A0AAV7LVE9_PLEWA|nr:hypothetical protein NDU88_000703 [Pleurodeles waltl]